MSNSSSAPKAPPALANSPYLSEDEDRTVCFCHCVRYNEIVAAILAGATTLEQIKDQTRASTGCGGCECDVIEVLETQLKLK